jgi:DNA-binding transcriptional LysR family regulator
MGLRRWRYFAVLAEEMNFTRAAQRLCIAQPALSQQIKRFEQELGVPLIERHGPTFELTKAGRVAASEAWELTARSRLARDRVIAAGRGRSGLLAVAYTRSAPGGEAGEIIARFRELYPDVDIRLETGWTSLNLRELLAGRLDAAFVRPPIDAPGIACRVVATEELVLAVATGHPLARRLRIRPSQMQGEPVVFWPRANGPGMHDLISGQVWPDDPPRLVREEPDDEQLLNAVAQGIGIAVVPLRRARAIRAPGVSLLRFDTPPPLVYLGVAYHEGATNPALARFLEVVEEMVQSDAGDQGGEIVP